MTAVPPNETNPPDTDALLHKLRRKQGNWVEWGQACQALQKSGLNPQQIFEGTGFEPIQQNQIIVAAQVYESIAKGGASAQTQAHFAERGSDSLYELRILSQSDRAAAADFIVAQGLDSDGVREIVKPLKEFAYRSEPPEGFTFHPGDALAFHYWRLARQQEDLQLRSRLIAQGLRYAHSVSARQQIETLLTDFSVVKTKAAPRLPFFRADDETELPRIIPVAGEMPLPVDDFKAVPVTLTEEPFGVVKFSGVGAWAPLPGWQVIMQAEDPVGVLTTSDCLPNATADTPSELVLVIIDRSQRQWNVSSYFAVAQEDTLDLQWFETAPAQSLLGQVILILKPKKILDEGYTRELWQVEE
ncbi:MAG: RuBisCO accumulation factor 1 [Cyanobacteria bacterium J06639_16]